MLLFYAGQHCFALDAESIVEVFPKVTLNPIPGQPEPYLAGLLNYGGKPIPVVDICQLIEKRPCSEAMHSRIILTDHLALLAEKVTETADLDPDRFFPSGLTLFPFLKGVYTEGERSIQRFDLAELHVTHS